MSVLDGSKSTLPVPHQSILCGPQFLEILVRTTAVWMGISSANSKGLLYLRFQQRPGSWEPQQTTMINLISVSGNGKWPLRKPLLHVLCNLCVPVRIPEVRCIDCVALTFGAALLKKILIAEPTHL